MTKQKSPSGGIAAFREFQHDRRTELVRDMLAKESAATDAKTARLKALRLARDAEDQKMAKPAAASRKSAAKTKRITVS